jgi:hypothetical protein
MRKGRSEADVAALALRRGWQIFGLAFLFRLQSWLISGGSWRLSLLKVDILNVMGLSLVIGAWLWALSAHRIVRILLFAIATAAVAMSTPLIREAGVLAALPDAIEAYIRPLPGRTNFALFPWAGFVFAGAIAGELVAAARSEAQERALQAGFLLSGLAGIVLAFAASFRPSIYPVANFWTSSPTFFFIRLGLCTRMIPFAWSVDQFHTLLRNRFGIGAGTEQLLRA